MEQSLPQDSSSQQRDVSPTAASRQIKIAECFYSLQGEGGLLGVPSFFLRTSGCNLRCVWCDTPYTSWRPEGELRTVESLVAEVLATPARHAVVTGGEPMIAPAIGELTQALRAAGLHITIETAGTVWSPVACDLFSISPKLANATPGAGTRYGEQELRWAATHERLRWQPEVIRAMMAAADYQLKFVVAQPEDLAEIATMVQTLAAPPGKVILMPEGTSRQRLAEREAWLPAVCLEQGYRYSPRLHVDLWGDRRGV